MGFLVLGLGFLVWGFRAWGSGLASPTTQPPSDEVFGFQDRNKARSCKTLQE